MRVFQTYDDPGGPALGRKHLPRLRKALKEAGLDGFIVPHEDEWQNEYTVDTIAEAIPMYAVHGIYVLRQFPFSWRFARSLSGRPEPTPRAIPARAARPARRESRPHTPGGARTGRARM